MLVLPIISALTVVRDVPSYSTGNSNFQVTYTVSDPPSQYFLLVVDNITGGCTFSTGSNQFKGTITYMDDPTMSIQVSTPSSGTCVFSGYYQYGDGNLNYGPYNLAVQSVLINEGVCVAKNCEQLGKECGEWDDGCNNGGGGIVCGPCTSGKTCNSLGQCVIGTCTPSWQCSSWSTCSGGTQTRTCTDSNNCGITTGKPATTQTCGTVCTESWTCGSWSACSDGTQTRTCTDSNNCGTTDTQPSSSQTCNGTFDLGWLNDEVYNLFGFSIKWFMIIALGVVVILILMFARK